MQRIGVVVRTILAVGFAFGGAVHAGGDCLVGISDCTTLLRRQTSMATTVDDVCRSLSSYMVCIKNLCPTSLTQCDIRNAGNKLFESMATSGYTCRDQPELSAFLTEQVTDDGGNDCHMAQSMTLSSSSSSTFLSPSTSSLPSTLVVSLVLALFINAIQLYLTSS